MFMQKNELPFCLLPYQATSTHIPGYIGISRGKRNSDLHLIELKSGFSFSLPLSKQTCSVPIAIIFNYSLTALQVWGDSKVDCKTVLKSKKDILEMVHSKTAQKTDNTETVLIIKDLIPKHMNIYNHLPINFSNTKNIDIKFIWFCFSDNILLYFPASYDNVLSFSFIENNMKPTAVSAKSIKHSASLLCFVMIHFQIQYNSSTEIMPYQMQRMPQELEY